MGYDHSSISGKYGKDIHVQHAGGDKGISVIIEIKNGGEIAECYLSDESVKQLISDLEFVLENKP